MTNPEIIEWKSSNRIYDKLDLKNRLDCILTNRQTHDERSDIGEEELVAQSLLSFHDENRIACDKSSLNFILNRSNSQAHLNEHSIGSNSDLGCFHRHDNHSNLHDVVAQDRKDYRSMSNESHIRSQIQYASISNSMFDDHSISNRRFYTNNHDTSNNIQNSINRYMFMDQQNDIQRYPSYEYANLYHFDPLQLYRNHMEYNQSVFTKRHSNPLLFSTYEERHFDDREPKLKRKRLNSHQLFALETVFEETCFPSTDLRNRLGLHLGLSPRTIQIWFQNKRQSSRNKNKETTVNTQEMNQDISNTSSSRYDNPIVCQYESIN